MHVMHNQDAVDQLHLYLQDSERSGRLERLLTAQMDAGLLNPTIDGSTIEELALKNKELGVLLSLIQSINGLDTYRDTRPDDATFFLLQTEYTGADGKLRKTNPKYIPRHIVDPIREMQSSYLTFLDKNPQHVGAYGRPGLVVMSGYRSHHYQLALFALTTLREGLDHALASMRLPGENSDHADYTNCAIDFTVIGDRDGNQTDNYGNKLPPEATVEMQWLIHNANEYGFYHSFPPDETDPTAEIGRDEIIPEAWHLKFAGSIEEAKRCNELLRSKESFIRRIEGLGLKSLF